MGEYSVDLRSQSTRANFFLITSDPHRNNVMSVYLVQRYTLFVKLASHSLCPFCWQTKRREISHDCCRLGGVHKVGNGGVGVSTFEKKRDMRLAESFFYFS
mmetsp:Transcript_33363/g.78218  ORF Transcript_33363/g.78218 Transcript_33363/m.78218 type:complete len:101 (+) Transcript_33363:991-1293(+)